MTRQFDVIIERDEEEIETILCADWGKEARNRAVYVAEVSARRVYRLQPNRAWSLPEILDAADGLSSNGPFWRHLMFPSASRTAIWPLGSH